MHLVHVFSCRSGLSPICKFSRDTADPAILKLGPGIISTLIIPHQQGNIFTEGSLYIQGSWRINTKRTPSRRSDEFRGGREIDPMLPKLKKKKSLLVKLNYVIFSSLERAYVTLYL